MSKDRDLRAFALREEYAGTVTQTVDGEDREVAIFQGGVVNGGDVDLNIAELLEAGDGTIVVDPRDPVILAALEEYPALKPVGVPDGADPINDRYSSKTLTELRRLAKRAGVEGRSAMSHAELVDALEAHDRGEDPAATTDAGNGEGGEPANA